METIRRLINTALPQLREIETLCRLKDGAPTQHFPILDLEVTDLIKAPDFVLQDGATRLAALLSIHESVRQCRTPEGKFKNCTKEVTSAGTKHIRCSPCEYELQKGSEALKGCFDSFGKTRQFKILKDMFEKRWDTTLRVPNHVAL